MNKIKVMSLFVLTLSAYGCSYNQVATDKIADKNMTCSQIEREIGQVTEIKKEVKQKRGLSGRNVGLAILFWPGIIVNEMHGSEAEKLANKRLSKLNNLHTKKSCR